MKKTAFLLFIFYSCCIHAQSVIGSINSGALSNNTGQFSVGEIFVVPVNTNEANSGTLGILYQLQFVATGINNHLYSDDARFYPNPVNNILYFESKSNAMISELYVYDVNGKMVKTMKLSSNTIDMTSLSAGTYIIKTNSSSIEPFKIIKQ